MIPTSSDCPSFSALSRFSNPLTSDKEKAMTHRLQLLLAVLAFLNMCNSALRGNDLIYQDDDLLCGPGFSPESYYQRIHQNAYQQRVMQAEYQQSLIRQSIADQKAQEKIKQARRNRIEKEKTRREEAIAKRKSNSKQ